MVHLGMGRGPSRMSIIGRLVARGPFLARPSMPRARNRTPVRAILDRAAYDREAEGRVPGQTELSLEGNDQ